MHLRKESNGIFYIYYVDQHGRRVSKTTGVKSEREARRIYRAFKKNHVPFTPTNGTTLGQFIERYLTDYSQVNHAAGTTTRIKHTRTVIFRHLPPETPLATISNHTLEIYKKNRLSQVSAETVNVDLRQLKHIFNMAVRWGELNRSPFLGVGLVPVPKGLARYFTLEELRKTMAALPTAMLRHLVGFAFLTGMRRAELCHLRWRDVDMERRLVLVRNSGTWTTKSKKERLLPLSDAAMKVLQDAREENDKIPYRVSSEMASYVFRGRRGRPFDLYYLSLVFRKAVRKAGLGKSGLHFHSLRHSFVTHMLQQGVPVQEVQILAGHSSVTTTMGYSHLSTTELHPAMNKLSL